VRLKSVGRIASCASWAFLALVVNRSAAFRHVALAELLDDGAARRVDRLGRHLHAVGTHIGDETDRLAADIDALIERWATCMVREAEKPSLRGGGLLQRRGL
jgi:hypothetical protein